MIDTLLILAGGRGSRLGDLTQNIPKPMIEVAGVPFIIHVLETVKNLQIARHVLSTGYKSQKFKNYFNHDNSFPVCIFEESVPLGTGGAIKEFLNQYPEVNNLLIMNGDSLIFDDHSYWEDLVKLNCDCIVGTMVKERRRFGAIEFDDDRNIVKFCEKSLSGPGYVNAGIYFFKDTQKILCAMNKYPSTFSLEKFVASLVGKQQIKFVPSIGRMIDMGTPESLEEMRLKLGS